jgi:ParB-like chromosome segregation protein Spo0J
MARPRRYPFHPLSNLLPMMRQEELNDLAYDIAEHGLKHPILLLDGKVLEGTWSASLRGGVL